MGRWPSAAATCMSALNPYVSGAEKEPINETYKLIDLHKMKSSLTLSGPPRELKILWTARRCVSAALKSLS